MNYPSISLFASARRTDVAENMPIDQFLINIKEGRWQDHFFRISTIQDPEQRKEQKKFVPAVTISGMFSERADDKLTKHSGFICIDIDKLDDTNQTKKILESDPYVYSIFKSISGRGLCVLFKINGGKHRESFNAISEHLFNQYKIISDPSCINPSRLRFVSFDPELYLNEDAAKWTKIPAFKEPKKVERIIFVQNDFDNIINELIDQRKNICDGYYEWVRIGFGLADHFGEMGRDYFHKISAISGKYDRQIADRQYNACLKDTGRTKSRINTVYYYFKQAGLEIYSERTKKIANLAITQKRAGIRTAEETVNNLAKHGGIEGDDVLAIVQEVRNTGIEINEDSEQEIFEQWFKTSHDFKYDEVSRFIYMDGKLLEERSLNDLWRECRKAFKGCSYDLMLRTLRSNISTPYNPLKDFIYDNIERGKVKKGENGEWLTPNIDKYFGSIRSHDKAYTMFFGKKWLVGIISHIFGNVSPLILILAGVNQGTGKTEFFRRMLPRDIKKYGVQSSLSSGKDDYILMTQKLLIFDDETLGTGSNMRMKNISSADEFTFRPPYGAENITIPRMAGLGATSNITRLLNDPTGKNRRFIIVEVDSIDFPSIDEVDRTDLFMEAYHLYKEGYNYELSGEEVKYLNKYQHRYEESVFEGELILQFFDPNGNTPMTAAQITSKIKGWTNFNANYKIVNSELARLGFREVERVMSGRTVRQWMVREKSDYEARSDSNSEQLPAAPFPDPVPFPKWDEEKNKIAEPPAPPPLKLIPPEPYQSSFKDFI